MFGNYSYRIFLLVICHLSINKLLQPDVQRWREKFWNLKKHMLQG